MIKEFFKLYRRPTPELVEKRVLWLVNHAWRYVPFYREHMKKNGVSPDDIRSLRDFVERFPTVPASEYRAMQQEKGPEWLIDKRLDLNMLIMDRSSGSSGITLSVYKTESEIEHYNAKAVWHLVRAGLRPWHRILAVVPPIQVQEARDSTLQLFGIFRRWTVSYLMPTEEIIEIIRKNKINAIYGQKSFIRMIADTYLKLGIDPPELCLLMPAAERVEEYDKVFLKQVFKPKRYSEFYGSTETGTIASWYQGEYKPDYHSIFFSLAKPRRKEGITSGSIAISSLQLEAQPILNIELGDQCSVRNYDKVFELGASIVSIDGRNNDYLVVDSGDRISGGTFYAALEYFSFMRQFRIVQERAGHCTIMLHLAEINSDIKRLVEEKLSSILKGRINYEIQYVDSIPIDPNGKTKILVSFVEQ